MKRKLRKIYLTAVVISWIIPISYALEEVHQLASNFDGKIDQWLHLSSDGKPKKN